MVSISLPEKVFAHLSEIAHNENRDLVAVVEAMIEQYQPITAPQTIDWDLITGVSDAKISDMSSSVRETLAAYYRQKYGNPD